MKERILEIINNSNKGLNAIDIIRKIKREYSVKDLEEVLDFLDELIKEGYVRQTVHNNYIKNDLLIGIVDMHEKGNAHVIINDIEDVFIPKNAMNNACDKDKVAIEIIDKEKNEGKIVSVLDRNIGSGIAIVNEKDGKFFINVKGEEDLPYNIHIKENDSVTLVDGLLLKIKYEKDIDKKNILASIDYVIGHKNAPDIDTKLIAAEFNIPLEFPEEVLEEVKLLPKELTKEDIDSEIKKGRVDFRNEVVFTIDGKDTKDIDDALSIKILPNGNYELSVHIADVTHYVKPSSAIWKEAEKRGNSYYLADKVIPMLPIELSNGICSLNPNVDRYTISSIIEIDYSGKIVSSKMVEGIINSRMKMNYDAVEDILNNKETAETKDYTTLEYIFQNGDTFSLVAFSNNMTEEELKKYNKGDEYKEGDIIHIPASKIIKNLGALSKILSSYKRRRGMLEFIGDEIKFEFDENHKVINIIPQLQRSSEKIIEDSMVVDNEQGAIICMENNIGYMFRNHDIPGPKGIEEFIKLLNTQGLTYRFKGDYNNVTNKDIQSLLDFLKDKLSEEKYILFNRRLLRCMQKAYYSPDNIGHFGLASINYGQKTAPIRRFGDLLNNYAIKKFFINKNDNKEEKTKYLSNLFTIGEHISKTERVAQEAEYAIRDMYMAEYMEKHIGEEYDVIIDTCLLHSFFVKAAHLVEGRVDLMTMDGTYTFDRDNLSYIKNGRKALRYGDKVKVRCISASKEKRAVDFALVRKL